MRGLSRLRSSADCREVNSRRCQVVSPSVVNWTKAALVEAAINRRVGEAAEQCGQTRPPADRSTP
jgi:16S rRNA U1498 N3-methylase RsmE